jgi:hypothetical protein
MGPPADENYRKLSFNPQQLSKLIKSITSNDVISSDVPFNAGRQVRRLYATKAGRHSVQSSKCPSEKLFTPEPAEKKFKTDNINNMQLTVNHNFNNQSLTLLDKCQARINNLEKTVNLWEKLKNQTKIDYYNNLLAEALEEYEVRVCDDMLSNDTLPTTSSASTASKLLEKCAEILDL